MNKKTQIYLQIYRNHKEGRQTKINDIRVTSKYHHINELIKDKLIKKDSQNLIIEENSRAGHMKRLIVYPQLIDNNLANFISTHNNRENKVKIDTTNTSGYRYYLKLLDENNQIHYFSHKPLVFGYLDKHYINSLLDFFGYQKIHFNEREILTTFFPDMQLTDNQKQHLSFLEKLLHEILDIEIEAGKLKDLLIFRGGTCLSLYYIPYRLSVDLDFAYRTDILKKTTSQTKSQFNRKIENINRAIRDSTIELCDKNGIETENIHFTGGGKSLRLTFLNGYDGSIDITYPAFICENYKKAKDIYIDSIENILGDKLVILFSRENAKITDLTDIFYILKQDKLDLSITKKRLYAKLDAEEAGIELILGADPNALNKHFKESPGSRDRINFMLPPTHMAAQIKDFTPFIRYIQDFARKLNERTDQEL